MKNLLPLVISLSIVLFGCTNSTDKKVVEQQQDTLKEIPVPEVEKSIKTPDELLLQTTKQVLVALKNKDYPALATFIHPKLGLTLSPYGFIDTTKCIKLSKTELAEKLKEQTAINWGIYDGSGENIILSPQNYFKKFVYSADFLNADTTSLNKIISSGNTNTNIDKVFAGCDFTESYFAGFDKKYSGMDWQSLILVYKKLNEQYKLVAIVHHQWTI